MGKIFRVWGLLRTRVAGSLAISLMLPLTGAALAGEAGPGGPAPEAISAAVQTLSLQECLSMALARQPAIEARQASLAAAETNRRAIRKLRPLGLIVREIPVRGEQATLGVTIASAELEKTRQDTVYAVTRLYYSVLYAREQKKVADTVAVNFEATLKIVNAALEAGDRKVTTSTRDKVTVYLRMAQAKQAEAARGIEQATAALREAMGVGPDCCVRVAEGSLPAPELKLCRGDIIDLALARRNEMTKAITASEITRLEERAQGTKWSLQAQTFAAGGDIHVDPVPLENFGKTYRPGAVGIEMPTTMAGCRRQRMERARDLFARSSAVVDKTRILIALEAEDAYLDWEEATHKLPGSREGAKIGRKLADDTRTARTSGQKVEIEDVLTTEVIAAQAEAQYNEVRHQLILALATLERVTAGGFAAGLAAPR